MVPPRISVITATYNAGQYLPRLIGSLLAQTDRDFEWVVADGGSTDETLALLSEASLNINLLVDSRPDFGIYDAMNRALRLSSGDYYLVVGADDWLSPEAVERYKRCVTESNADLITAKVSIGGSVRFFHRPSWVWLYGPKAKISSHSVGLCIRKSLHSKLGFYSKEFPIYADSYFLLKALKAKTEVCRCDFLAGEFSAAGVSNSNKLRSFSEQFQAHVLTGGNFFLHFLLFGLRLLKWAGRLR